MTTAYYLHAEGLIMPDAECPDSACTPQLVAVIPVEDREQVERLVNAVRALATGRDYASTPDTWQAALREFANPTPPKPDEPQGLGAVVEDESGRKWIRSDTDNLPWIDYASSGDYWLAYADIEATRVLSPGYTEDGAS